MAIYGWKIKGSEFLGEYEIIYSHQNICRKMREFPKGRIVHNPKLDYTSNQF